MNDYAKMMRLLGKYGFEGECSQFSFKGHFNHPEMASHKWTINIYRTSKGNWYCKQVNYTTQEMMEQSGPDAFSLFKAAIERATYY